MLPANAMLVSRYIIRAMVGRGGMAAVYDAIDTRVNRRVAIKEMSDSANTNPADQQAAVARFQQEARMLARLEHPNLPKVTDVFTDGGKQYLVMDFVDGDTLKAILESGNSAPLPETQVTVWAVQLCDVLDYLHACTPPIIFRDLKPSNIMIDRAGQVKLIDFGIARVFNPGQAHDTTRLFTPGYAAPEQHGKAQSDARADIHALGVTLHQALTGYDPTSTPYSLPRLRQLNPSISPTMETVVTRAMELDRQQRWQSVTEMRCALTGQPAAQQRSPHTPRPAPRPVPPRPAGPPKPSRPTTKLLMLVAQWSGPQLALALGALFVLVMMAIWFGAPIASQYTNIWNNAAALFGIVGPLVYAAVRRPWFAGAAHAVVIIGSAVVSGLSAFKDTWWTTQLASMALGAILSGLAIEGLVRLLPRVRGKNRQEAWQRELAWLTGMALMAILVYTVVAWGVQWVQSPALWIVAALAGALGWFLGDLVQQYLFLKQTGIKRGIGGS